MATYATVDVMDDFPVIKWLEQADRPMLTIESADKTGMVYIAITGRTDAYRKINVDVFCDSLVRVARELRGKWGAKAK